MINSSIIKKLLLYPRKLPFQDIKPVSTTDPEHMQGRKENRRSMVEDNSNDVAETMQGIEMDDMINYDLL